MDPIVQQLMPILNEDENTIQNDVNLVRQSNPGITDDQIIQKAQEKAGQVGSPAAPPAPEVTPPVETQQDTVRNYLINKKPASVDRYSPEAKQELMSSLSKPSIGELVAQGVSGLGDAIARSYGGDTGANALANTRAIQKAGKENQLAQFEAGRQDVKYQRDKETRETMDDPESPISKAYQELASKYTGGKDSFNGLSATRIGEILPVVEKSYQADQNIELRKETAAATQAYREALLNKKDLNVGVRQDQWTETQWQKLTDKVNLLNAGSRKALGVAATNNMRADRLLITAADPNATTQDIANIVSDIQAVYKGGVPDQVSLAHGDYKTFNRKVSEVLTYITSKPQSARSPEVLARLTQIAKELKDVDNKVVRDNLGINAIGFEKIIKDDPERWAALGSAVMESTVNPPVSEPGAKPPVESGAGVKSEIKQKQKDGRTAVFDKETKKFLRYE